MTGDLLAVDPSIRSAGVALFRGGSLIRADTLKVHTEGTIGERCLRAAQIIAGWVVANDARPKVLAVEWPQWYPAARSKVDPNDLAGLAGVCGALAGILAMGAAAQDHGLQVVSYTPAEWAGQTPKSKTGNPWRSPRGQRIRSRLTEDELEAVPPKHDAVDAVGIGLYHLGKFERVRIFPGATPSL